MRLLLSPAARKELAGLPTRDRSALLAKLRNVADDPFGRNPSAKAMAGGGYRLKHGAWRALYRIDRDRDEVVVDAVRHRREVYR
jgi:mRNA interferase RelE/StbE